MIEKAYTRLNSKVKKRIVPGELKRIKEVSNELMLLEKKLGVSFYEVYYIDDRLNISEELKVNALEGEDEGETN